MITHSICFPGEIRKIICGYPLLSGAMDLNFYRYLHSWPLPEQCNKMDK